VVADVDDCLWTRFSGGIWGFAYCWLTPPQCLQF